jgi:diadenosine tetraphosphatase ApaH/serine/threonine PP2A family protein phosphatase
MPLAAVIEKRVICMHGALCSSRLLAHSLTPPGGIGKSIESVEQLEQLVRPLTMENGGPVLMDLLWSDPTENDSITGLRPNARGPGLVTFGPDRVAAFLQANDLQMIIRAHECVMDGALVTAPLPVPSRCSAWPHPVPMPQPAAHAQPYAFHQALSASLPAS